MSFINLSSCFEEGEGEDEISMEVDQEPTGLEMADAENSRLSQRLEQADSEIAILKGKTKNSRRKISI